MEVKVNVVQGLQFTTVTNALGLKAVFCNLGASIFSIKYDEDYMTSHPVHVKDFTKFDLYHGKTIGPIVNRIKDGKVKIGEEEYQFDLNEAPNTLHGGLKGLSNQIWGNKRIKMKDGRFALVYTFTKKDRKGTLPGKINFMVVYIMSDTNNSIEVEMRAYTDKDTMVCLTNHTFFSLGEEVVTRLALKIGAKQYIKPNPVDLIPESIEDIPECLNFNGKKKISDDIDDPFLKESRTKGYDHCFILKDNNLPITLESDKYLLEILTDFPCVQIYTDNYENNAEMTGTIAPCRRSIAIEPQDSTLNRKILTKEEGFYLRHIKYTFIKK